MENGAGARSLTVLPEGFDAELDRIGAESYARTGRRTTFVLGGIEVEGQDGSVSTVHGVNNQSGYFVQADYLSATAEQMVRHEEYHDLAASHPEMTREAVRQILNTYDRDTFREAVAGYMRVYGPLYGLSEDMSAAEYQTVYNAVLEEVLASAYAGMNLFGVDTGQYTPIVRQTAEAAGPVDLVQLAREERGQRYLAEDEQTQQEKKREALTDRVFNFRRVTPISTEPSVTVQQAMDAAEQAGAKRAEARKLTREEREAYAGAIRKELEKKDSADYKEQLLREQGYDAVAENEKEVQKLKRSLAKLEGNADQARREAEQQRQQKREAQAMQRRQAELQQAGDIRQELEALRDPDRQVAILRDGGYEALKADQKNIGELERKLDRLESRESERQKQEYIREELEKLRDVNYQERLLSESGMDAVRLNEALIREYEKLNAETQQTKPTQEEKQKTPEKPVAKSKPIYAKQDFRSAMLKLFHTPEGKLSKLGDMLDRFADRALEKGYVTYEDRKKLLDYMYRQGVVEIPADEYYQIGRDAVRGGRVYVDEKTRGEFSDDWNDFRKKAFANGILFTSDPGDAGIDQWNMELAEMLPGLFDATSLDNHGILERIVQVAEEGKSEKISLKEYAARRAGYEFQTEADMLEGMERQMDYLIRSFSEKAGLELKLRDRTGKVIERERQAFAKEREAIYSRQEAREAREREQRQEAARRQTQAKELRDLQQKTLKSLQWLNANRNRAPADLQAAFDEVLSDLDLHAVGAANEMNWDRRYQATWRDLADMYKDAKENDPNWLPSQYLQTIVDRLDARKIADLDVDALNDLYKAAVGLRTELYNRRNLVNDQEHRLFAEVYDDVTGELNKAAGGWTGKAGQAFRYWQLTPMNRLEQMAGWKNDSTWAGMSRQLEEGERTKKDYTVRAKRTMERFIRENTDWLKTADGQGKNGVWYEVEVPELIELGQGDKPIFGDTKTIYMTPLQKVQIYLESRDYDALRHMAGGRTFVDRDLYSKGKRSEALAQGTTVRLAPETVQKLVSDLTAQEQALAAALEQYYNGMAKTEINRVSNIMYGYDKARSAYYAPIYTDSNYNRSEAGLYDVTAEGVGHLKGRVNYAKNPSYNLSALEAFDRHVDQTALFVGMTVPIHNWNTLMNWGGETGTLKKTIAKKWGGETNTWIHDLLTELQDGKRLEKKSVVEQVADTALGKYIQSVFGFNPGIVVKQALSLPLAGTYLGYNNFPNVDRALKTSDALINTYTSELSYRLLGYSTPETAQLTENRPAIGENKLIQNVFGGGGITAMDGATVKTIWRWAENAVRKDSPDLEVGTQAQVDAGESPFYQEVARRFEEAVSRSQPMYDVMHRSDAMRSNRTIARAFTLFKTVPQQQLNMLAQTVGEANAAKADLKAGKIDREAYVQSRRRVGRAVTGIIIGGLGIEAMNLLVALIKNGAKRYRDDEGELTFASAGLEMLRGFGSDMAGMVVGGDLLYDVLGSLATGDKWYGLEAPGITQMEDVIEDILSAGKTAQKIVSDGFDVVKNGGDLGEYLRRNGGDYVGALESAAETAAAYIGGIPAGNMRAYLLGLVSTVFPEARTKWEDLTSTADRTGLKGLTGDALEVRMGDILKNRLGKADGDTVAALSALYEAGYTNAAPSDTPKSVTIDGESHTLTAAQKQLYDTVWADVVGSRLDELVQSIAFRQADQAGQEKLLKKLYEHGADLAKSEVFDGYESSSTVQKMVDAGVDTEDALTAVLAIDALMPREGSGSVTNEQKALAVAGLGLSKENTDSAVGALLSGDQLSDYEVARKAGVDPEVYLAWKLRIAVMSSIDSDGDGKEDISKQEQVVKAIDALPITGDQKDTLYLTQYKESTLAKNKTW